MSGHDDHQAGTFRQRLDAILRQRNPSALRAFLIAQGQWESEARTDEEAAMWMMIAASPVLADLHAEAERWLMAHGHEHEARAILGGRRQAPPLARRGTGAATQASQEKHTPRRSPERGSSSGKRTSKGNRRSPRS